MIKRLCRRRRRCALLVLLLWAGIAFWRCLPYPLFDEPFSAILLDRNGQLLGARIADDEQWRFPETAHVPDKFRRAIVAFEDKRFYHHPGVDPLALARALALNVKYRHVVSGGSTLSMQVIRLARKNPARTYSEKLIELVLALRLELRYSKAEIMALYAGHAPFGGNVVGLEAAAWRYFGRTPENLSWAETCTLAVLPNDPALIHPGRNRLLLKKKRDGLLRRLHRNGALSEMELTLAIREPLPDRPQPMPREASHLLDTLLQKEGSRHRFDSTLDARLQRRVDSIVSRHAAQLRKLGVGNVAALVIDNETFEVMAYIGNSAPEGSADSGPAIDLIQRPRSTGSVLKPFLFAAMLQSGDILPRTLVADLPTEYGGYMPQNYDRSYRGAVPAQEALAHSLNIPAVRMLRRYGVDRFYDFLQHAGMTTLFRSPDEYGLTLVLGGAEGTLWDLTGMYANLASIAKSERVASPRYRQPKWLMDSPKKPGGKAEFSPAAAWLTLNALVEVARPGTEGYWKSFSSSRKIAWKTGTSYGLRDAWAIGTTSRYTVGVWTGNADGEGQPHLTGTTAAAPVLFDIFSTLKQAPWFVAPLSGMKQVSVCKDDGYLANSACSAELEWVPNDSHFERVTPHHQLIHLDKTGLWRVHSRCEPVSNMQHKNWFILPPGQAFYYRKRHPEYRSLPPFRPDCLRLSARSGSQGPIGLLYPHEGTQLYIPVDLGGKRSKTVFQAAHDNPEAILYWHLDDEYIGMTKTFHEMALDIGPGHHRLTLVDDAGNRLVRNFTVLGKESPH